MAELLLWCQREVWHNLSGHPVFMLSFVLARLLLLQGSRDPERNGPSFLALLAQMSRGSRSEKWGMRNFHIWNSIPWTEIFLRLNVQAFSKIVYESVFKGGCVVHCDGFFKLYLSFGCLLVKCLVTIFVCALLQFDVCRWANIQYIKHKICQNCNQLLRPAPPLAGLGNFGLMLCIFGLLGLDATNSLTQSSQTLAWRFRTLVTNYPCEGVGL